VWELADKAWFRDALTEDEMRLLLTHVALHGTPNERLLKTATLALWALTPTARLRRMLLELGTVGACSLRSMRRTQACCIDVSFAQA
jgi:hypothetical protein